MEVSLLQLRLSCGNVLLSCVYSEIRSILTAHHDCFMSLLPPVHLCTYAGHILVFFIFGEINLRWYSLQIFYFFGINNVKLTISISILGADMAV